MPTSTPLNGHGLTSTRPRFDLHGPIHKALRHGMAHALLALGRLDPGDDDARHAALADLDGLLALLRSHLQQENDFVHTAIEARQPGGARQAIDAHAALREAIDHLGDEARGLREAPAEQRSQLATRLYRHLAAFFGEKLLHMQAEETRGNAALWALYGDGELAAIHDRLVATIPPADMARRVRWMAAALSVPELVALFTHLGAQASPPQAAALLDIARAQLDQRRWAQLARGLGQPPVPGLMTV